VKFLVFFRIRKWTLFPVMIVTFQNAKIKLLDWLGLISSTRKFIYKEYEIMIMNSKSNANKVEQIVFSIN
jgi:hypothetical protein